MGAAVALPGVSCLGSVPLACLPPHQEALLHQRHAQRRRRRLKFAPLLGVVQQRAQIVVGDARPAPHDQPAPRHAENSKRAAEQQRLTTLGGGLGRGEPLAPPAGQEEVGRRSRRRQAGEYGRLVQHVVPVAAHRQQIGRTEVRRALWTGGTEATSRHGGQVRRMRQLACRKACPSIALG